MQHTVRSRTTCSAALLVALSSASAALFPVVAAATTEDAELVSLVSPLPPANSNGGAAVSISNGTAVIGAPAQNSAYVYTYDGGTNTWTYQTTLTAGVTGDKFGASVSISGANVAIGAPGTSSNAGAVYIFNGSGASWSQTAMLTESGASSGNRFGYAAAMDGLRLVIGAPYKSFGGNTAVGTAYLYSSDGTNWNLNTNISLPAGQQHPGAHIGASVALSGAQLLVGAPDDTKGSHSLSGNVYDFVCNGTNCTRAQRISPGPINNAHLGSSLAILNNTALIGAQGDATTAGNVYVYKLAGSTWSLNQTLNGTAGALFGSSVALAGQQAVVGASGALGGGTSYLYGISGGSYTQLDTLSGSNTAAGDAFGTSITLAGGEAVVGAPFATNPTATNSHDGGAYAYKTAKKSITAITNVNPTSSVTNESYTVSVQVSNADSGAAVPSGSVLLADDIDSTATCTATLTAGTGSCSMVSASLGQGAHNFEATYAGDGIFGNSSAQQAYEVDPAATATTITSQNFNPSAVGQTVTFTVNVTPAFTGPAVPTGSVTITDNNATPNPVCTIPNISLGQTCTAAFSSAGTIGLVATYAGDQNFNGSADNSASHETDAANTTASVSAAPEPSVVGQQVTFTVTVTPAFGGTPTGSATVSDTSNNVLCTVPDIVANRTCTYTFGSSGSTAVVVAYSGDSNFNASNSSAAPYTHVTNAAGTTVSVTPDHNPSFTGGIVTFTVGVTANAPGAGTPTGSVMITDSGSNIICVVADITTDPTCSHAFSPAGSYSLTAQYSGDGNFNASSLPFTQVVNDAPMHLAISTVADVQQGDHLAGVTIAVVDNVSSNPDSTDNTTQITLTLNTPTCGGTVTFGPITVTAGVADFSGLEPRFYNLNSSYVLTASSSTGLPTVNSNSFAVVAGNMIFSNGFDTCRL